VVVVIGASAVLMEGWRSRVPAILLAWYPGMEGGRALADVLLGVAEPGGRLPFVMPAEAADLPHFDPTARTITYDGWWGQRLFDRDGRASAFPFGFGLGYGRLELQRVELQAVDVAAESAVVEVDVTNPGTRRSGTVVQLYAEAGNGVLPRRQLVGFTRVILAPGATDRVMVAASLRPLSRRDPATRAWSVVPGTYRLVAAQWSGDPAGVAVELPLD
jgi:beta-glucosidase